LHIGKVNIVITKGNVAVKLILLSPLKQDCSAIHCLALQDYTLFTNNCMLYTDLLTVYKLRSDNF